MNSKSERTLHRLEQNESTKTQLQIGGRQQLETGRTCWFNSRDGNDFSRLGAAIGENSHLTHLRFVLAGSGLDVAYQGFYDGLKRNSSIYKLEINFNHPVIEEGVGREILKAYQENNNLTEILINNTDLQNGGDEVVAESLRRCTNLHKVCLMNTNITDGQLLPNIVEAVIEHRSLKKFGLFANRIGNAWCGVLATLLRDPSCNLHTLDLRLNHIGNEGTTILANALATNTKLKKLYLGGNPMDDQSVVDIFAKLLCDTSSISNTYSSNHTLRKLLVLLTNQQHLGEHLDSLLKMNKGKNKSHVAIKKILKYHPNIDMTPFYEWNMEGDGERDLKALPYVVAWFDRAEEAVAGDEDVESYNIRAKMLSAIYQFACDMPLLFVPASHNIKRK